MASFDQQYRKEEIYVYVHSIRLRGQANIEHVEKQRMWTLIEIR